MDAEPFRTPKTFFELMSEQLKFAEEMDEEIAHICADAIMCDLLTSLGYGEGVKIFKRMLKWYT